MAGMLPGVECARRRRFHQSGAANLSNGSRTIPSSFFSSSQERRSGSHSYKGHQPSNELDRTAREAKQRLDQRLRSIPRRGDEAKHSWTEVVGVWWRRKKVRWRGRLLQLQEEEECVVCLEEMGGEEEDEEELRCGHRFHRRCVEAWLRRSNRCPCCRAPASASAAASAWPSPS